MLCEKKEIFWPGTAPQMGPHYTPNQIARNTELPWPVLAIEPRGLKTLDITIVK